jgi:hypothetical protein
MSFAGNHSYKILYGTYSSFFWRCVLLLIKFFEKYGRLMTPLNQVVKKKMPAFFMNANASCERYALEVDKVIDFLP